MTNRYIVDLGSVKLDEKTALRLDTAIQKAALTLLAEHDISMDLAVRLPRDWRGIWIDRLDDLKIDDTDLARFGAR